MEIKQSNDFIQRNIYVYQNCIYPWDGVFIHSVIRVDKIVNCKETKTHYYISNDTDSAESFLQKILQEWSVETMHFYKDTALNEDRCKINKGAFSFSILRSIVINRLLLKPFSIFGYMSLRSYFNLKYKSNFNITKI